MKIDEAKNLKTGDCLWCVVCTGQVFTSWTGWTEAGLPQEFIFLSPMNSGSQNPSYSKLHVANKDNGETTSVETNRAGSTKTAAIQNAVDSIQAEMDDFTNRRKRFEGMLGESK